MPLWHTTLKCHKSTTYLPRPKKQKKSSSTMSYCDTRSLHIVLQKDGYLWPGMSK
jgi:hypothetical protein